MASSNNNNNNGSTTATAGGGPSFSVGTWFDVPIRVHYSYFLVVVLSVLVSLRYASFKVSFYEFLVMGPILFLTILIHEFGHIMTSKRLGGEALEILMWPLGGMAVSTSPNPATPQSMLLVAAGGPATHVLQALFWIVFVTIFKIFAEYEGWNVNYSAIKNGNGGDFLAGVGLGALYLNVVLFLFNMLLPAYPLDGGQIFASALLMNGCSAERAARITSIAAMVLSSLLIVWGLLSLFVAQNPFSILTILIGAWIFKTSHELYQLVENGQVTNHPLFRTAQQQQQQQQQRTGANDASKDPQHGETESSDV